MIRDRQVTGCTLLITCDSGLTRDNSCGGEKIIRALSRTLNRTAWPTFRTSSASCSSATASSCSASFRPQSFCSLLFSDTISLPF